MKSNFVALEMAGTKFGLLNFFLPNILLEMKPTHLCQCICGCESTIVIAKNKIYNGKNT